LHDRLPSFSKDYSPLGKATTKSQSISRKDAKAAK
jgi:hypothetical protein